MALSVTKPTQTTFLEGLGNGIKNFWQHQMAPFLLRIWSFVQMDVLQKLEPYAIAELDKLDQALFSQGPEGVIKAWNQSLPGLLQAAETVAGATIHDVFVSLHGSIVQRIPTN